MSDVVTAAVVLAASLAGIVAAVAVLIRALVLHRLVDVARNWPAISLCLAMSARGNVAEAEEFRRWLITHVDRHGWQKTEEILEGVVARVGAGASVVDVTQAAGTVL